MLAKCARAESRRMRFACWLAPRHADADIVEWEGTRYRVDLARAEGIRLIKSLGSAPQAWLSSADAAVRLAAAVSEPGLTRDGLRRQAEALALAVEGDAEARAEATPVPRLRQRGVIAALRRAAAAGDLGAAPRLAPGLRLLADELTARGLTELAYAAALGDRDGIALAAGTRPSATISACGRGCGPVCAMGSAAVRAPMSQQRWRVSGALLGLESAWRSSRSCGCQRSRRPGDRRSTTRTAAPSSKRSRLIVAGGAHRRGSRHHCRRDGPGPGHRRGRAHRATTRRRLPTPSG